MCCSGAPLHLVALYSPCKDHEPVQHEKLDYEGDDTFHGTRESYSYLSDVEWSAVEQMSSIVGEEAVWSLLSSRVRDQQHSIIANFLQRELDAPRAEVTLLHQHSHQQTELLRQQQSQYATAASTRDRRHETLKLEVSKYRGGGGSRKTPC